MKEVTGAEIQFLAFLLRVSASLGEEFRTFFPLSAFRLPMALSHLYFVLVAQRTPLATRSRYSLVDMVELW